MQACSGAAVMGSIQQPIWVKGTTLFQKGHSTNEFPHQIKLYSIKPCRFSYSEGSLVSLRPPSSVSVPVLETWGIGSFEDHGLYEADPEVCAIISKEKERQFKSLELIASENFTSRAVMEAVGSCLTNKYSEGLPGKRYYGGNEYIDDLETLCQKRALDTFHLDEKKWGVNVQPLSGLGLASWGHLSHGFMTPKRRVSGTSVYFESMPYRLDISTDSVGAFLMMDMAHISGLVAASVVADPFEFCDIVTTTTHKDPVLGVDLESAINNAVFPVCLKYAQSPEFMGYQTQVVSNCRALANRLMELGYKLVSGGSDNHLVLVDLRPLAYKSALVPVVVYCCTPAMTTRGFTEKEFIAVADFIKCLICVRELKLTSQFPMPGV
ncbi:hypothetical protein FNV43_RR18967 [Rhamnella rubrinervis]|uniref:Serine hydroxymethyltransferase-like domain-containing protein n=1 Tax=Rhamnella rubrinervis TaxID=2594499 RepID=A0A8K0GWU2_9ROSA|nr:hypothetical protein FNV43_RR18967 [Rhamnella rubrinervis]